LQCASTVSTPCATKSLVVSSSASSVFFICCRPAYGWRCRPWKRSDVARPARGRGPNDVGRDQRRLFGRYGLRERASWPRKTRHLHSPGSTRQRLPALRPAPSTLLRAISATIRILTKDSGPKTPRQLNDYARHRKSKLMISRKFASAESRKDESADA
jgi:hypothetical protein